MFQIEIRPFLGSDEEDARRNVNKFLADNPARENICDVQILSSQPHAHGNWQMRIGLG